MAKKLTRIEVIEEKLLEHLEQISSLFPPGMVFSLIGRDPEGSGCEFMMGDDDPEEVIETVKRTIERLEEEKPKKKAKKKS